MHLWKFVPDIVCNHPARWTDQQSNKGKNINFLANVTIIEFHRSLKNLSQWCHVCLTKKHPESVQHMASMLMMSHHTVQVLDGMAAEDSPASCSKWWTPPCLWSRSGLGNRSPTLSTESSVCTINTKLSLSTSASNNDNTCSQLHQAQLSGTVGNDSHWPALMETAIIHRHSTHVQLHNDICISDSIHLRAKKGRKMVVVVVAQAN